MSRFLMGLAASLPLRILHAVGTLLGWAMYGLSPTYRRHVRANLETAGYRAAALRRAAIASAGRMLAEISAVWLRPQAQVMALVRRIDGWEHVEAARAGGRGIVFLTLHLGCFELTPRIVAERLPVTVLHRASKLGWLQPVIEEGRGKRNVQLARAERSGVRKLLAALLRKEAVLILPDQVPGEGEGEWVDFFGRPAYTMTLAARLAARAGHACLLIFCERLARGDGYAMHIRPLPDAEPGEGGVRRINRALEALVRERPEQYLWGYNRYKRPKGAPALRPGGVPVKA